MGSPNMAFLLIGAEQTYARKMPIRIAKWFCGGPHHLHFAPVDDEETLREQVEERKKLGQPYSVVVIEAVKGQDSANHELVALARELLPSSTLFIRVDVNGQFCDVSLLQPNGQINTTVCGFGVVVDDLVLSLVSLAFRAE